MTGAGADVRPRRMTYTGTDADVGSSSIPDAFSAEKR
jgi:hypothetical protein